MPHFFESKPYFDTESHLLSPTKTFLHFFSSSSNNIVSLQIKIPYFLNMESQPKSIQDAPPLCNCHLLFQFLLYNLVRIFCPPLMLPHTF